MRRVIMGALQSRKVLIGTASAILVLGLGVAAVKSGVKAADLAATVLRLKAGAVETSAALGMRLEKLTVEGRSMTAREDLLAALDIERGEPILAIDVAKAREEVEALPWVKAAKVSRDLPDAVHIQIEERTAYALWQQGSRYTLVDRDGRLIVDVPQVDMADQSLPLIVGADAPRHAADLFAVLETNPALAARVRAAVRVGDRRWNLYFDSFDGGMAVRLPEDSVGNAWTRLGVLERDYKILERDLEFLDLRMDDRLIVRLHKDPNAKPPASKKPAAPKRET